MISLHTLDLLRYMTGRSLPPLRALQAFEATARHLSISQAAAELGVTPGAVSHQIKTLEDWLGAALFHRLTRALRLTEAGEAALPLMTEGFDRLAAGTARMQAQTDSHLLTISVSPGFGSLWLVPRLDRFRRNHPDIEVRLDGTDRLVDISKGEADVAIRYGMGGYSNVHCDRLFAMRATPVCSPGVLKQGKGLRSPSDLAEHTLLHVEWKEAEGSWRTWLLAAGALDVDPYKGPRFTKEEMAVRAALDGEGVALIGDRMAADHLASGRLIRPFDADLSTPLVFAYFLLRPEDREDDPKISAFRKWILEEAESVERDGSFPSPS
ncbi:transcriptional regulator GcvA [Thalassococcus sp. S3]|uniref:transcriptional regulator GcvA n=1 Tax=Thalassococcus sp. S3 TaxID=2017482 RepID=UPI00102AA58E|nr:transcriptional regulator GcvA [Thalassococcus sp. S3]